MDRSSRSCPTTWLLSGRSPSSSVATPISPTSRLSLTWRFLAPMYVHGWFRRGVEHAARWLIISGCVSQVEELASRPVGALTPSHHSFNSRAPEVAQKFLLTYTDAVAIEPGDDVHEYGNGTCALLKWVQFTEQPRYQIHFVDNWRKRDGPLSTSLLEDYWTRLHGNLTDLAVEDDFMGNRMGFATKDLTPIRKKLAADGVPVRDRGSSLLVLVPPGELLLEIVEEHDDL